MGSKRKLNYVYDAVSEKGSLEAIAAALAKQPEGGVVTYVLTYSDEQLKALPKNVKAVRTLVATAYGEDSDLCSRVRCPLAPRSGQLRLTRRADDARRRYLARAGLVQGPPPYYHPRRPCRR